MTSSATVVRIRPAQGGAIVEYASQIEGVRYEWFVGGDEHPACFAMLPFCSRVRDGRFEYNGRKIALVTGDPHQLHPIHGHGPQACWRVDDQGPASVRLSYLHQPDSWPWRYRATQEFELHEFSLRVKIGLENLSDEPMPFGLGLHPYLPRPPGTRVKAHVSRWWPLDEALMASRPLPVPAALDPGPGIGLDGANLDHVFGGWHGRALVYWPGMGASLTIECAWPAANLVLYAPEGQRFVCVEPATNVPNAFNLGRPPAPGVFDVLEAGAATQLTVAFRPELDR